MTLYINKYQLTVALYLMQSDIYEEAENFFRRTVFIPWLRAGPAPKVPPAVW